MPRLVSLLLALVVAALVVTARVALAGSLLEALGADDPRALAAAVADIEQAPTSPELADTLFAAARACEDRLHDPARALALYERLLRELPHARVAIAAERRATMLRASVGARGEHAREATELEQLIANADTLPPETVIERAARLADATWDGAPDAALWLAEYERRLKRYASAQERYARVAARWPGTPQALAAIRGGAGNAIDHGAWSLAEELTRQLPTATLGDRVLRDDLFAAARRGRLLSRIYLTAWIALVLVAAGLVGSLVEASLRGGRRWPALRPPFEVWFLAPLAALLVAYAYLEQPAIAPTVTSITLGGLVLAWLSGATLDVLRARARPVRWRATLHVVGCGVAVLALCYITVTRNELVDLLVETIRSGPEG